ATGETETAAGAVRDERRRRGSSAGDGSRRASARGRTVARRPGKPDPSAADRKDRAREHARWNELTRYQPIPMRIFDTFSSTARIATELWSAASSKPIP